MLSSIHLDLFSVFNWDVYLANKKDTTTFSQNGMTIYNSASKIKHNGLILLQRELLNNVHCLMDLRNFPFDIQYCEMFFVSFQYPISKVNFTQELRCNLNIPCNNICETFAFKIISINASVETDHWEGQDYAVLNVQIVFQRQLSFYLYQVVCQLLILLINVINHNKLQFFILLEIS